LTKPLDKHSEDALLDPVFLEFITNQETDQPSNTQELSDVWDALDSLADDSFSELAAFDAKTAEPTHQVIRPFLTRPIGFGAIAAALLIALILPLSYLGLPTEYSIAKGQQLTVTLRDNSTVELGGNTLVTVQEGWGNRSVSIEKGNAYFSVTPNRSKPFTVHLGDSIVTVLGTTFNIYRSKKLIEVVVESGKVNISENRSSTRVVENVDLTKNQKLIIKKGQTLQVVRNVDINGEIGWRHGFIHFKQTSLETVVERMSDFYNTPIYIRNKKHRNMLLTGVFKTNDLDNFLASLALVAQIKVDNEQPGVVYLY